MNYSLLSGLDAGMIKGGSPVVVLEYRKKYDWIVILKYSLK